MRTIRILMIPIAAVLFSGALMASLPGCGGAEDLPPITVDAETAKNEDQARAEYAKTQKKETVRRTSGRGTDPRG